MLTMTLEQVAAAFHRPPDRFDHPRLSETHGFPRPLPGFRSPLIWSSAAIVAGGPREHALVEGRRGVDPADVIADGALALRAAAAEMDRHFGAAS